jgi:hypothetical protein
VCGGDGEGVWDNSLETIPQRYSRRNSRSARNCRTGKRANDSEKCSFEGVCGHGRGCDHEEAKARPLKSQTPASGIECERIFETIRSLMGKA